MADIRGEIDKLRAQLLDMGKSNNLANYQSRDDRSVRIADIGPGELFDKLVMDGEEFRIVSSKSLNVSEGDLRSNASQMDIDGRMSRLMRIYCEDFEDLGYTTIYAAMGFMNWRIGGNAHRAPIVLVPLGLKRDRSGNAIIYWNGDDVRVSPTFVEKLREFRISVPLPGTIEDVPTLNAVLDMLRETTDERTGFRISDAAVIDTFDFSKSAMYNDIDPAEWTEIPPLVDMILNPSSAVPEEPEERSIPSCTYSILDGDSSQMDVVMDVLEGRSVVVEGPPGTGKSQTIANIISECLGNGKRVLFVSEKMAALNVVKKRLDRAGLSSYVLELHSDNMNRKNFLKEMERSMGREEPFEPISEQDCMRLERIRGDLDAYNEAVSAPIGERELTPYQLIGMRENAIGNIRRRRRTPVRIDIVSPQRIDNQDWDGYVGMLRSVSEVVPQVMPIKKNFWRNTDVRNLTPDREYSLRDNMLKVNRRLEDVQSSIKELCKVMGVPAPQTVGDMVTVDSECKNILRYGSISLKDAMEGDPDEYMRSADAVINALEEAQAIRTAILGRYGPSVLETDAETLLSDFERVSKKRFLSMNKGYRDILRILQNSARDGVTVGDDDAERDLRSIREYRAKSATFSGMKNLFGEGWKGIDSDTEELKRIRDWMVSIKRNLNNGRFSDTTALVISRGGAGTPLEQKNREVGSHVGDMMESLNKVFEILNLDPEKVFKRGFADLKPATLKKWLKDLNANMGSLRPWGSYCDLMDRLNNSPLKDISSKISNGDINPMDAVDTFVASYSSALLADAVNGSPKLNGFSYEMQESLVKDFDGLDRSVLEQNGQRLRKRMYGISRQRMAEEDAGIRILKGEFNRGTGQMPVRKIMNLAGTAVQAVKPCFMMSPMSVAQYLGNKEIHFDVVIFDEASQVVPADSLGSLMRADQAVIMGDSKQLPPTVFFERKEEGTSEVATAKDMESLLNLCRASLPVRVLSWHYRSRHDSLMALSNRLFYDDKLMVCPSPSPASDKGLKLRYVRTAVYDRGATASNPKEAQMIARAVWHHYVEHPDKSLGVACFNINQQKAITEEVEKMFKRHPDARANMARQEDEPFIIRNLENIQGDERDVMFVSIGYGYDSDGKLSKSFGALNRAGGERRLNVLMTRAREQCVIFSNFRAMDMGMRENVPEGVSALQAYLEYAEHGRTSKLNTRPIKDDLVESIGGFLASKGVKTAINVGTSGFRIDIAVCSPKDPSVYILGICLDGPAYHRMHYTRDRDRTFMNLLRQMGWDTYRLWSMDWYSNPEGAKRRLWNRVSGALNKVGRKQSVDPELFDMVSEMVETDTPICRDALLMKIRTRKKLQTVPAKFKDDVDTAVDMGITLGRFIEEDGYLMVPDRTIVPKERSKDERWRPEWIHPQEYIQALKGSVSVELSDDEIIAGALDTLGLPNHKIYRDEASRYFGLD